MAVKGHCLCGAVEFEIQGETATALHCHCTRCRRWSGGSFLTMAVVGTDQITITKGRDAVHTYREAGRANRSFCVHCGTALFGFQWPDGPRTVVPLGSLEDPGALAPTMHINVQFKAPWFEIHDDLQQFAGFPGR